MRFYRGVKECTMIHRFWNDNIEAELEAKAMTERIKEWKKHVRRILLGRIHLKDMNHKPEG